MKQLGFTTIELVTVIIILAVIGVTATSQFLNINEDAEVAKPVRALPRRIEHERVSPGHLQTSLSDVAKTKDLRIAIELPPQRDGE